MASTADPWNTIPRLTTETVQFDPFNLFESWQISSQLKGQHSHISSSWAVLKTSAQQSPSYNTWHPPSMALHLIKTVSHTRTHTELRGCKLLVVYQTAVLGRVCTQSTPMLNLPSNLSLMAGLFLEEGQILWHRRRTRIGLPRTGQCVQDSLEVDIIYPNPGRSQHT